MKTSNDIDTIKKLLAPVFQKNEVIKAVVFGSASKGSETKKSDLDLMIIKDTRKRLFDRYDEFDEIFKLIKDRAIDILIYTPEELESISHRPFIKMIINEGQQIYEHWKILYPNGLPDITPDVAFIDEDADTCIKY